MADYELEDDIYTRELDDLVNKYGAFCGILLNKNISCVTFFSQLLHDEKLRNSMASIGHCSWFDLVKHMTYRYPILHKSKKINKIL
jgi:hypothetical protein|tara:strand:+ start:200 stop:457 length:258 start_codon:yes stop_codon:yes gene_type:complete